jgi:hypothetical protein
MPAAPCLALWGSLSSYLDHNSRDRYQTSTREYPDGGREWAITPSFDRESRATTAFRNAGASTDRREGAVAPNTDQNRVKNNARAARTVKRLARYEDLRYMWTPTFPGGGVHDYQTAYELLARFLHDHGDLVHHGGPYIAVPELHPGGHGWHFHVLLRTGMHRGALCELQRGWTLFLSRRGLHALSPSGLVRHHIKRFASARLAGRYAGKYVSKAMGNGLENGRQRYLRSEGLTIPEPLRARFPDLPTALRSLPHPLFWERFFSGIPNGEPWYWMSAEPPG